MTSEEELRWTQAWSQSADEAADAARRDVARATGWSFEAFADFPLVRHVKGDDRAVAMRPAGLAAKATPYGMFWAIRNPVVAGGGSHEGWSQFSAGQWSASAGASWASTCHRT